jgi:hypothetical protein
VSKEQHRLNANEEYKLYVRAYVAGMYGPQTTPPPSFKEFIDQFVRKVKYCTGWIKEGDVTWFLGISSPLPENNEKWLKELAEAEARQMREAINALPWSKSTPVEADK